MLRILRDGRFGKDVKVDESEIGPATSSNAPMGCKAFSGHVTHRANLCCMSMLVLIASVWKFLDGGHVVTCKTVADCSAGRWWAHFHFHPIGLRFHSGRRFAIVMYDNDSDTSDLSPRKTITLPKGLAGSNFCRMENFSKWCMGLEAITLEVSALIPQEIFLYVGTNGQTILLFVANTSP